MTVRLEEALKHVDHALAGEISSEIDKVGLVNRAGEFLYNVNPWSFTRRRSKLVDTRGQITVTNATWTESSLTVTKTGAFTNYTFVEGDQFQVTGGTNALLTSSTVEYIEITSNPATNQIVLAQSLGSDADGDADIDGTMRLNSVALPADFRSIISIQSTDSLVRGVKLTSIQTINEVRTTQLDVASDWDYLAAILYAGSPPTPILEIWPTPSRNELGAMTIFYKKRWTRKFTDSDVLDFPEFVDHLFLEIVRAFAMSYENGPAGQQLLPGLLANIEAGPEFRAAKSSDGSLQWNRGRVEGGGSQIYRGWYHRGNVGSTPWRVAGPS
jgi:hypothetical protein